MISGLSIVSSFSQFWWRDILKTNLLRSTNYQKKIGVVWSVFELRLCFWRKAWDVKWLVERSDVPSVRHCIFPAHVSMMAVFDSAGVYSFSAFARVCLLCNPLTQIVRLSEFSLLFLLSYIKTWIRIHR